MSTLEVAGYRVLAGLGQGGMARVYLACSERQPGFTKLLVLKLLKEDLCADTEILEMFVQEAKIAARLNHANVIQTYEVGQAGGLPFIAMEFLEGQSLSAVNKRLGKDFSLPLVARTLSDALCGLHYAHELTDFDGRAMGIVHRDVSPQNIFLTYDGGVKILDFGIAKIASSPSLTKTGVMKGKVGYMAPEQVTNKNVDRRADVFAVGVMLWEAIARRRLVEVGTNEVAALQARLTGEIANLRELAPDAPEELVAIAEKALALAPEDRYATAEEMQHAIEDYLRTASNPQPRDIGRLVREAFASERASLKKTVEQQLSRPSTSLPTVQLSESSGFSPAPRPLASKTPEPRSMTMEAVDVEVTQLAPGPTRSARRIGPIAAAALVAAALVALVVLKRGAPTASTETKPTASAPAEARPSPPPASAEAPQALARSVTLTLDVKPKGAIVLLDGAPVLATQPLTRPADERGRHELTVSAAGYKASTREVVFDHDQTLAIELAPSGATAPATRPGTRPPAQTATTTAPPPPTSTGKDNGFNEVQKRTPRPIDTSSPF